MVSGPAPDTRGALVGRRSKCMRRTARAVRARTGGDFGTVTSTLSQGMGGLVIACVMARRG